ncbi:bifunctional DNA-formamidopyrimidine glycosylase/DNA-(apurinic or apyrimidinic site) lyase [Haloferula sp.]|uniref:bifunctional DNA-formamidopyrimidine glycosylase/DNA-(apurinic or apyrimidinic site) lyase n=1 Tax=Haloferula sp. TaxID=2497595 RepID=UPI00329D6975
MPELPEVETTRRGITPHLSGVEITDVIVRNRRLRYPVSKTLDQISGDRFVDVRRRAKYLILDLETAGSLIVHLGMSGSLRLSDPAIELKKHDHVILELSNGKQLRFHDPRRFGIYLHLPVENPLEHRLLSKLGPEPLSDDFDLPHLKLACRGRKAPIKQVIMDNKVVVGVGNIYASEALFRAGIRPTIAAGRLSGPRLGRLVESIREVLHESIEQGGTTLRDFVNSDGEPGYFSQRLFVYDRFADPCRVCQTPIRQKVMGQRSTYWCPNCQK